MGKLKLTEVEVKELVKEVSDNTQWSDYCRDNFLFDEWTVMSLSERKEHFNNYIDESNLSELIEQDYWEGIFAEKPSVENDMVVGIEEK